MTHTRDPSALSQVVEYLQAQPVGTIIWARHAHLELPHLNPHNVSAALSLLASPKYARLRKLPKQGRLQPYRVTSLIRHGWNGHRAPARRGGEKRPRAAPPQPSLGARAEAAELLLEAATACEDGAELEQVLATIRTAYYKLKGRK